MYIIILMKAVFVFIFAVLLLVTSVNISSAANERAIIPDVPEKNGDYPDPSHPGVRVRVFVHEPREKNTDTTTAAACSADDQSNAVVGATGWKLPTGIVSYRLNTASVPSSVGGNNLPAIVQNGFASWSSSIASGSPKPLLTYAGTTNKNKNANDGQNIVAWGRTSGNTLGVTYVRYYTASGLVVDVDTIMNFKFSWTLNTCSATSYDAADILVHELGHWYGLDDEYTADYIHNTMYGYGAKAENKKVTPTTGDIDGINLIYHL